MRARKGLTAAAETPPASTKGAVPNLFDFIIGEALERPGATAESVASAIASSQPFLKAVQLGMAYAAPAGGPTNAQETRIKLAQAFSAPTSGAMF
jgi:hypothetical protein